MSLKRTRRRKLKSTPKEGKAFWKKGSCPCAVCELLWHTTVQPISTFLYYHRGDICAVCRLQVSSQEYSCRRSRWVGVSCQVRGICSGLRRDVQPANEPRVCPRELQRGGLSTLRVAPPRTMRTATIAITMQHRTAHKARRHSGALSVVCAITQFVHVSERALARSALSRIV